MGKCLSCFHVRTSEPLPSPSDSFLENHIDKTETGVVSTNSTTPLDATFPPTSNHLGSTKASTPSSMSNGTTRHSSHSKSNSAGMPRVRQNPSRSRHSDSTPTGGTQTASESKIFALFETYRDRDAVAGDEEPCILADGIEQLCQDLELSPDDVRILIFAWKLDAGQMCRFTRSEFMNGLKGMNVDSIKDIQNKLPELLNKCRDNAEEFKSLYRFTFRFGLDSSCGQRILPIDMAVILWRLVFSIRVNCDESYVLTGWLKFLSQHTHVVRGVPRDTWNMFLTFYDTIGDDLSKYDDTEAWPSLLDDFVDFQTDKSNQNSTDATNRNKIDATTPTQNGGNVRPC